MRLKKRMIELTSKDHFNGKPKRTDTYLAYDLRHKLEFNYGGLINAVMAGCDVGMAHITGSDLYKGRCSFVLPSDNSFTIYAYGGGYRIRT